MDLEALGRQFGLTPQQTQAAFEALAPVVAAGVRRNTSSDGGLANLIGALAGGGHARYADDPSVLATPEAVEDGNAILGHVFGSKDVSRAVAQQASVQSGLDPALLRKMLPMLAMLVTGFMARQGGSEAAPPAGGAADAGATRPWQWPSWEARAAIAPSHSADHRGATT